MEEIIRKLRIKHTLFTTIVAGIILLTLLGGFFGILHASTSLVANRTMEDVLAIGDNTRPPDGTRCFAFSLVGGQCLISSKYNADLEYYGEISDVRNILKKAVEVGHGNFNVDNMYFSVISVEDATGIKYAVYDRTWDRNVLVNTALILSVFYVCAMLLVGLLAYLLSVKTTSPMREAMKKQRDLVANASHELKTPLTVISTDLSVMKLEPNATIEENSKWIESIDGQVARMDGLIKNMLELSKMENIALKKQIIDFSEITEGACLEFEAICFEKKVTLLSEISKDAFVFGDREALERLVIILLDNAIKYCGDNGKVGCRLVVDKRVRLEVLNTGAAISKEEANHVFDRFYRADGARENRDGNSYGLGLSIAQATVIAHGGTITCRGVEGKGTVFNVVFPMPKKKDLQGCVKKAEGREPEKTIQFDDREIDSLESAAEEDNAKK